MTDTPVGDDLCLHAVLIEPQLARFRRLCGLEGVPLATNFEGWHRHAVLAPDGVFLFPRDRSRVAGLRREAVALRALEGRGVPAPRLLGEWGYGVFSWEQQFDRLHRCLWESYAAARGGSLPSWWAVHLCFCVKWADWFSRRAEPTPWQRGRLATTLALLRRLEQTR